MVEEVTDEELDEMARLLVERLTPVAVLEETRVRREQRKWREGWGS